MILYIMSKWITIGQNTHHAPHAHHVWIWLQGWLNVTSMGMYM